MSFTEEVRLNAQQCLTCRSVHLVPEEPYEKCPNCGAVVLDFVRAVNTLAELAEHVGAMHPTEKSIARRLFKDTRCGISFWMPDSSTIGVAGYAEGIDAECPSHLLEFGRFTPAMFDAAVEVADQEGCDLFDEVHG